MADTEKTNERQTQMVLVVIQHAFERNYASMLLQRFGYHVCTVNTSKEALRFLSGAVPALIIADEDLACPKGFDLLNTVQQIRGAEKVPVILITSTSDPGAEARYREKGYRGVLGKPINADMLYRAVQNTIERYPRQNIRVSVYLNASIEKHSGNSVQFATVLSENGMFIRTTTVLPVKSRIRASLIIKGRSINVEATVLYSNGLDDYPRKEIGIGMSFSSISPEDREYIKKYIQGEIEKDIEPRRE